MATKKGREGKELSEKKLRERLRDSVGERLESFVLNLIEPPLEHHLRPYNVVAFSEEKRDPPKLVQTYVYLADYCLPDTKKLLEDNVRENTSQLGDEKLISAKSWEIAAGLGVADYLGLDGRFTKDSNSDLHITEWTYKYASEIHFTKIDELFRTKILETTALRHQSGNRRVMGVITGAHVARLEVRESAEYAMGGNLGFFTPKLPKIALWLNMRSGKKSLVFKKGVLGVHMLCYAIRKSQKQSETLSKSNVVDESQEQPENQVWESSHGVPFHSSQEGAGKKITEWWNKDGEILLEWTDDLDAKGTVILNPKHFEEYAPEHRGVIGALLFTLGVNQTPREPVAQPRQPSVRKIAFFIGLVGFLCLGALRFGILVRLWGCCDTAPNTLRSSRRKTISINENEFCKNLLWIHRFAKENLWTAGLLLVVSIALIHPVWSKAVLFVQLLPLARGHDETDDSKVTIHVELIVFLTCVGCSLLWFAFQKSAHYHNLSRSIEHHRAAVQAVTERNPYGLAVLPSYPEALFDGCFDKWVFLETEESSKAFTALAAKCIDTMKREVREKIKALTELNPKLSKYCHRIQENDGTLLKVDLHESSIGDDGATALAIVFHIKTTLEFLHLENNQIGDEGATALAQAFKIIASLRHLNLENNQIGDEGATALAQAFKTIASLEDIRLGNNQFGDKGAEALAQALKSNASVRIIHLENNQIGRKGATALAQALKANTSLRVINIGNNRIGDEGAKALAQALKTNTSLQILHLENNWIGHEGATVLAQAFKTNTSLEDIHLENNWIGDKGVVLLAQAFKTNTSLRVIHLENNWIGDEGAAALAQAFKTNTSLEDLHLENNHVGDEGAKALAQAFKTIASLKYLRLENNWIGHDGATALAQALKTNASLQNLHLENNRIGNKGAKALAQAFETNTSLQYLSLGTEIWSR
jgi:Ran GTPase-activating protein (RanGAP) involved in mRNA processing and transport